MTLFRYGIVADWASQGRIAHNKKSTNDASFSVLILMLVEMINIGSTVTWLLHRDSEVLEL